MVHIDQIKMVFVCRGCGDVMIESVMEMLFGAMDRNDAEIIAPNLCPECGRYETDEAWGPAPASRAGEWSQQF